MEKLNNSNSFFKYKLHFVVTILVLLLTVSLLTLDIVNFFTHSKLLYRAFAKLAVSFLCSLSVLTIGKNGINIKDTILLSLAFVCTFIGGIFIVITTHFIDLYLFYAVGGIIFAVCLVLLIIRHCNGFKFFLKDGKFQIKKLIFPLMIFVPFLTLFFIFLLKPILKVGLFWRVFYYTIFLPTSLWIGWETLRSNLFPRKNAWLISIGMTSFFIMEVVGIICNIKIGTISDIAFIFTWFFYVPFLVF